jgi:hypothetical protein
MVSSENEHYKHKDKEAGVEITSRQMRVEFGIGE